MKVYDRKKIFYPFDNLDNENSILAFQILINSSEMLRAILKNEIYLFENKENGSMYYSKQRRPKEDDVIVQIDKDDQKYIEALFYIKEYLSIKYTEEHKW